MIVSEPRTAGETMVLSFRPWCVLMSPTSQKVGEYACFGESGSISIALRWDGRTVFPLASFGFWALNCLQR
jgi:hypothetical protein